MPEDAPYSQNLFVYILEHPSRDEAKKNWDAFHDDLEWKKVKAESEAQDPLVDYQLAAAGCCGVLCQTPKLWIQDRPNRSLVLRCRHVP
jgi:hypothetical protein